MYIILEEVIEESTMQSAEYAIQYHWMAKHNCALGKENHQNLCYSKCIKRKTVVFAWKKC
jgi:hypothetical protein